MVIKVALIGTGRMGRLIAARMMREDDLDVVAAFAEKGSGDVGLDVGLLAGVGELGVKVSSIEDLEGALAKSKPDVAVDFTIAKACCQNTGVLAGKGVNLIIGTTGFSDDERKKLEDVIRDNGVGAVISPNMSIAVNVYWNIVKKAAGMLKDYDVEVVEAHHRFKKDAPSGTAMKTAGLIAEATGRKISDCGVYGRKGLCPRKEGEIGIHSIRAGDIVGDHTVYFGSVGEHLELTHRAHSRDAFVNGVILAVRFIDGKKGVYGMDDVLGLN
ncbi:MAG: 4-hydroxy-tetrahydrodipicolinate reductase [Candidatus Altiarchaeota archaeon]